MSEADVVRGHGVGISVPPGWDVRISDTSPPGAPAAAERPRAVILHAANFPLPPERGSYGSGAVERMTSRDLLICVIEFEPASAATALFTAPGVPSLAPDDFAPATMQRPVLGQSGVQRFFHQAGRAFCAYVVLGSHRARHALAPLANDVLSTLEVSP